MCCDSRVFFLFWWGRMYFWNLHVNLNDNLKKIIKKIIKCFFKKVVLQELTEVVVTAVSFS
jgi:hypothetical protein